MLKRILKLFISYGVYIGDIARDGIRRILRQPIPARGIILYYHAIKARQRTRFTRQLDELIRYAVPFRLDAPAFPQTPSRHAAITFDDGFVSVVENALPELKKRNIPFTVFVPSGCLGQRPSWIRDPKHSSWEERLVSPEELRALASDPLVTIGSHSISHPNFLKLDPQSVEREFARSKSDLESILGRDVTLFSYPHGAHSAALNRQAHDLGYHRVFTIQPALVPSALNDFAFGRILVDPADWMLEFRLKLAGAYRWQHALQTARNGSGDCSDAEPLGRKVGVNVG